MLSRQEAQARNGGLHWATDVRKKPPGTQQGHTGEQQLKTRAEEVHTNYPSFILSIECPPQPLWSHRKDVICELSEAWNSATDPP